MKAIENYIIDSETIIHYWEEIEKSGNTNLYISSSNYLLAKQTLVKIFKHLETDKAREKKWHEDHNDLIEILSDSEITDLFIKFTENKDHFMMPIKLLPKEKNISIIIYKGFELDKQPGMKIHPTIDEVAAFALVQRQLGNNFPIQTMSKEIIEFCKLLDADLTIMDLSI